MFSFRRILLPQVPSTSSRSAYLLDIRRFSSASAQDHFQRNVDKFVHVATTGYSFTDSKGKRVAKYGIYWGKQDARNGIRTLPDGQTNVAAMLTAILEAINVAREEEPPPPLLIYSDLTSCESLLRDLSVWAKRDFYRRNSDELMRNSQLLHDLFVAVQGLHLKIVHRPASTPEDPKNRVMTAILEEEVKKIREEEEKRKSEFATEEGEEDGLEKYCIAENIVEPMARMAVIEGTVLDKDGKMVEGKFDWPEVYVAARCTERDRFISAGYCTHWPSGQVSGGRSYRFVPFPVTLFRAELAAIEEALKQAVDEDIQQLTIITSSAHFMNGWRNRWTGTAAERKTYSGKVFYERICDLCARLKDVNFRYVQVDEDSQIGKELEKRCIQGLSYGLVGKDKSENDLELDDLVTDKMDRREGTPVVRLFKTGTEFNAGFVWEDSQDTPVTTCGTPQVLIRILENAIVKDESVIVIRADSERLIKNFEARMEIWRRNGWRNSQHKRIAKWAEWEKAWKLKQKVHVFWEYMDPADDDDRRENRRIPVYTKK